MTDNQEFIPEIDDLSLFDDTGKNKNVIDGRTYNNNENAAYVLPNDEEEADRLDFQHRAFKYLIGGLFKSPIQESLEEGIHVVDSGCGPATWTLEMSKEYPNSKFTGVDISFVDSTIVQPDNVELKNANITKEIPFEDESIDFYFQRLLMGALNKDDYKTVLENAYKALKPGGFIELSEGSVVAAENGGPIYTHLNTIVTSMLKRRSLMPDLGQHIESFLKEAGFENINYEEMMVPLNHTNKIGQLNWYDNREANRSLRPLMAMINPEFEDVEKYEKYLDDLGEECAEYKTSTCICFAYGQKPLE
ncbi:S-adenosyl-L-methionine-dependent methyltransferase [Pilobolus umbonatus]|nr:S-adenosyl-L-methionine-dependent methyltransferase [Pilobolus umbonatus]